MTTWTPKTRSFSPIAAASGGGSGFCYGWLGRSPRSRSAAPGWSESAGLRPRVRPRHQPGEIFGMQERRRRGRTPVEQAAGPLQGLRRPQLVVDDAVHVGVVLGEVARRVLQVPEEIGARVVPAETPDVA